MRGFELARPDTLDEAVRLLDTDDPTVRPMSGGTALMLMMKTGVFQPSTLVHLAGVEERHRAIEAADDGGLLIGGLATLTSLERSREVATVAPVITKALKRLANVRVRNVACVGGNLAHGDPHMDLPPVLASLGGTVIATGPGGERSIAVEELFSGYYETVLAQGELISAVRLPSQTSWRSIYLKCTTRSADDWPTLGVALSVRVQEGRIEAARLMVSAATEKLTRAHAAEAVLIGQEIAAPRLFARAAEAAVEEVETMSDARGSDNYKTDLVRVYVRRALEGATRAEEVQ